MSAQPQPKNPFKGLRPFKQEEQEELFGRDRDLILMKDRILSSRTTLLFAGSGVGKTSFLNAKVIPALSERYCVVWHNRWTGAEEKSDAVIWDDHRRFRAWPPQAFIRWFGEWLVQPAWVRQRNREWAVGGPANRSTYDSSLDETESPQRKVTDAIQNVISQSLRPGNKRRLSRVLTIFKKKPDSLTQQKPCILILDQFEEIFQYHAYEQYFQDFISDLCKVINDDTYQVRVVFSMREEFLGELSVFDNRIPDLFNNYYRLRYPEKDEAKYIIEQTCKLVDVEPAPKNLDILVDDLATIEKSFEAGAVAGEISKTVRLVRRNFVPPPYLQIVCDTLWKEQFENPVQNVTATTNGDNAEQRPVRFLENYKIGSENAVNGDESGARKAVREFCEAKLSQPFLKTWEQNLAARAFGFLVTKQGAKMAYELRSLASHMDERIWPVRHTLQKLSRPDARILRETRGPEGSYWFELYHDMYAGVVDRWKRRYRREQRRRQQRRAVVYAILVALAILVPLAVLNWVINPRGYRQTINQFVESLDTTDIQNHSSYTAAVLAYSKLSETFGHSVEARVLWARVWQKRAQLFEANEHREEALLSLLQAAQLAKGDVSEKDYVAQANNLLTGNEEAIKQTYCYDCQVARLSPDGQYILTVTTDGQADLWSSGTDFANGGRSKHLSIVGIECTQAQFSSDSKLVTLLRPITDDSKGPGSGKTLERLQASGATPSNPEPTPTPGSATNVAKTTLGWEVRIVSTQHPLQASSFVIKNLQPSQAPSAVANKRQTPTGEKSSNLLEGSFRLKALANRADGYLVAGFQEGRLTIWRQDGTVFVASVPLQGSANDSPSRFGPGASFSPDGKFLFVAGPGLQSQLWEVTSTGLTSVSMKDLMSGRLALFSSDNKYLLGATSKDGVKVWELSAQPTEVLTIPTPDGVSRIGFAPGANKFFVSQRNGSITIWDIDTRQRISTAFQDDLSFTPFLQKDGRYLVLVSSGGFSGGRFEKLALDTGLKVGELRLNSTGRPTFIYSDGDSVLLLGDSIVRLWDVPPLKERQWLSRIAKDSPFSARFSGDGNTLLMVRGELTKEATFQLLNVNEQKEILPPFKTTYRGYELSPDGSRIMINMDGNTVNLYDRTRPESKNPLNFARSPIQGVFSPDSRIFALATDDNQVHLIDTTKGVTQRSFTTNVRPSSMVFSHNNEYLLVGTVGSFIESDNPFMDYDKTTHTVEVWSVTNGQSTNFNLDERARVEAVAISNERIAMFQNQKILVFNLGGGKITEFDYGQDLAFLSISPNSKLIVTSDHKGLIQLWNADSGSLEAKTTIGNPAQQILFDARGTSFIAITDHWMHRIEMSQESHVIDGTVKLAHRLDYAAGIFTGEIETASLRLTSNANQEGVRWLREGPNGLEIVDGSFDGKRSKQILTGDPDKLWENWQAKLGFIVMPSGQLEKALPDRPGSMFSLSTPASR